MQLFQGDWASAESGSRSFYSIVQCFVLRDFKIMRSSDLTIEVSYFKTQLYIASSLLSHFEGSFSAPME